MTQNYWLYILHKKNLSKYSYAAWPGLVCRLASSASSWGLCPLARRDPAYSLSLHLNMLFILQIFILFLGNGRPARKKAFIQLTLVNPAPFSRRRLMGYQSVG